MRDDRFFKILNNLVDVVLSRSGKKPNYSNRDFMNAIIIFQEAMMDKMHDLQDDDKMNMAHREEMANMCGKEIRKMVKVYTGLDTHDVDLYT